MSRTRHYLVVLLALFCRVPSADSVRVDRTSLVNCATSYSAGTERDATAEHADFNVERHQQAWTNTGGLSSGCAPMFPAGKPPLPPLLRGSNFSDTSSPQHMLSKKEEDLSEEWFVDLTCGYYVIAELFVLVNISY